MAYGIVNVKGAGGSTTSGVFLADVSDVSIAGGDGAISITWTDPDNVVVSGLTVATWAGTLIVRKVGSVPTNKTDGTVVMNSTVKNSHQSADFIDTNVTNGTQYFYRFFPYSGDNNYTDGSAVTAKPSATVVPIPYINSVHTYDGTVQTPTFNGFDGTIMSKTGDTSATNANESTENPYTIVVSLTDPDVIWADGSYTPKTLTWNMAKADNVPVLSKTSLEIVSGDSYNITATALGDGIITASSLNTAIATVVAAENSGSTTATVSAVNKGGTAVFVNVAEGTNYKAGSTYCSIDARRIPILIPTVTETSKVYTGAEQHPTVTDEPGVAYATRSGDYAATNVPAEPYTFTYTINDTSMYEWEDGTIRPKTFEWNISKATEGVTLDSDTATITTSAASITVGITNPSGGELSVVSNSRADLCDVSINGTDLVVTKKGKDSGATVITVASAATSNYVATTAQITVTIISYKVMTVKIDQGNSNPATCCSYYDDAQDMTAKSAAWDEFFGHYPCMMTAGVEGVKLNPNNYEQDIDGNPVNITSGSADVMVAFPRCGLKISTSGNVVTISMTNNPNDSSFEYMAHKRGNTVKDKFYIGAYMGSEVSSKLRSLKGQAIAVNRTIGGFRTLARANSPASNGSGGSGYDQHGWYQLMYLQAMFVLKYKNLNSQEALGRGFVDGNSGQKATGGTETKGMDWGETTGKDHMKCFGVEDLWGNVWSWIDGMATDANRAVWTATQGFNDSRTGYTQRSQAIVSENKSGYFDKIVGDTHCGFTPKSWSGSETTYYSDYSYLNASAFLKVGGHWGGNWGNSTAGMFEVHWFSNSESASHVGSRLMFL